MARKTPVKTPVKKPANEPTRTHIADPDRPGLTLCGVAVDEKTLAQSDLLKPREVNGAPTLFCARCARGG